MSRGCKVKLSTDDNEQRMFTLRYTGKLHNRLAAVVAKSGRSLNYYLTKLLEKHIAEEEAKQSDQTK